MEKLDKRCARQRVQQGPKPERGMTLAHERKRKARELNNESNGKKTEGGEVMQVRAAGRLKESLGSQGKTCGFYSNQIESVWGSYAGT